MHFYYLLLNINLFLNLSEIRLIPLQIFFHPAYLLILGINSLYHSPLLTEEIYVLHKTTNTSIFVFPDQPY